MSFSRCLRLAELLCVLCCYLRWPAFLKVFMPFDSLKENVTEFCYFLSILFQCNYYYFTRFGGESVFWFEIPSWKMQKCRDVWPGWSDDWLFGSFLLNLWNWCHLLYLLNWLKYDWFQQTWTIWITYYKSSFDYYGLLVTLLFRCYRFMKYI